MHASLSLWQDLKILSIREREGGRQRDCILITSGKKSAQAKERVGYYDVIMMSSKNL